jgi:hypothetical protein
MRNDKLQSGGGQTLCVHYFSFISKLFKSAFSAHGFSVVVLGHNLKR